MSNSSLKIRIAIAAEKLESGEIGLAAFRSALISNGSALEGISYSLIKELEQLEYLATINQYYKEEECESSPADVVSAVKNWLNQVPE